MICLVDAGAVLPLYIVWDDGDGQCAFGSFLEEWAFEGLLLVRGVGVDELHSAFAENFEAIVKVGSGSEGLGPEAGTGVVDFDELDGLRGAVLNGRDDEGGTTSCQDEQGKRRKSADGAFWASKLPQ